jgi:hypothetical protein
MRSLLAVTVVVGACGSKDAPAKQVVSPVHDARPELRFSPER